MYIHAYMQTNTMHGYEDRDNIHFILVGNEGAYPAFIRIYIYTYIRVHAYMRLYDHICAYMIKTFHHHCRQQRGRIPGDALSGAATAHTVRSPPRGGAGEGAR